MSTTTRRSLLQLRILVWLDQGAVKTITELAGCIKAQRPSVSRSLKTLRQEGLVERNLAGWRLTKLGKKEAKQAATTMADTFKSISKVAQRALPTWEVLVRPTLQHFNAYAQEVAKMQERSVAQTLTTHQTLQHFDAQIQAMARAWRRYDTQVQMAAGTLHHFRWEEELANLISDAIRPVLSAQQWHISALETIASSAALTGMAGVPEMLARNNALVASIVDNIHAVGIAAQLESKRLGDLLYASVEAHLRSVTQSYWGLLVSRVPQTLDLTLSIPPQLFWTDVTLPAMVVSSYTRSLRWAATQEGVKQGLRPSGEYREGTGADLDRQLLKLGPDFVAMRQGSWQALHSTNPDRIRHATISSRELLRQVLDLLVPGVGSEHDEADPKLKRQIRQLMAGSGTSADFATTLSTALAHLRSYLSKLTHTNYKDEQAARGALLAGEGLLLFLLAHHEA